MGTFIAYLLETAFFLLILFAFNKLVLSKETFHKYNRWAWLAVIVISLLLPLANCKFLDAFSLMKPVGAVGTSGAMVGDAVVLPEAGSLHLAADAANPFGGFVFWAALLYFIGAAGVMVAFAVSYVKLVRLLCRAREGSEKEALLLRCKKEAGYDGRVRLLITTEPVSPMSWMHYVIMNEKDITEDGRAILLHEISHIKAGHSWDLLLTDLLIIFQWFNPAAWLLKQSLQQVQEYGADSSVLEAGVNAHDYQLLLIKKAVGQRLYSMANSFNHSKLKNRITMMLKEKSSKWAYAKCLYIIPLALVTGSLFATPKVSSAMGLISEVEVSEKIETADTIPTKERQKVEDNIEKLQYAVVDVKPLFFGEDPNRFSKWVGEHLVYPAEARKTGTAATIYYQFTIDENGKIGDVKVLKTPRVEGDRNMLHYLVEEGTRVLSSSPNWTPGSVKGKAVKVIMNFPVIFMLEDKETDTSEPVPYALVEEKPSFQGQDANAFSKWVGQNLIYPPEARKAGAQGRISYQFTVDENGKVCNVKLLRNPIAGKYAKQLEDEGLRTIQNSPDWTPGRVKGKEVKVIYNFPVIFQIGK